MKLTEEEIKELNNLLKTHYSYNLREPIVTDKYIIVTKIQGARTRYIYIKRLKQWIYTSGKGKYFKLRSNQNPDVFVSECVLKYFNIAYSLYFEICSLSTLFPYSFVRQVIDAGYSKIETSYYCFDYDNTNTPLFKKINKRVFKHIFAQGSNFWLKCSTYFNLSKEVKQFISALSDEDLDIIFKYSYIYEFNSVDKVKLCIKYKELYGKYKDYIRIISRFETGHNFPIYPKYKDLNRYHDLVVEYFNNTRNLIKQEKIKELNQAYQKVYHKYKSLEYKNDVYSLILPTELSELDKEGQALHHCVGSYKESVTKEKDIILFLRYNDNIGKPFITVNIDSNFSLRQIHGACNNNISDYPDAKDIINFLQDWVNKNKISNFHKSYGLKRHL